MAGTTIKKKTAAKAPKVEAVQDNGTAAQRLEVLKTYKLYVGGQFPRTESGRYYVAKNKKGEQLANVCLSSRKDFRDAVIAARGAQKGWAGKAANNRGQIL